MNRGQELKTQDENTHSKALSKPALINTKKPHENVEFIIINSLETISRQERKKGASQPLYLARYE
jgi:hypothetical protein